MIEYKISASVSDQALNALFADAWPGHTEREFSSVLARSLGYICAFAEGKLVGFVNVAWDGGSHAFLLDPTVHTGFRHRGIGAGLVRRATVLARTKGVQWLHVDYEPNLAEFYAACGFRKTEAGIIDLTESTVTGPGA